VSNEARFTKVLGHLHSAPKGVAVAMAIDLLQLLTAALVRLDDDIPPERRAELYEELRTHEYGRAVKGS
jgi:hypothetical protein